jgi:hypothetical protein
VVGKPPSKIKPWFSLSLRTTESVLYVCPFIDRMIAGDEADADADDANKDADMDANTDADMDADMDTDMDTDVDAGVDEDMDDVDTGVADVDAGVAVDMDDADTNLDATPASSSQANRHDVGGGRGGSLLSLLAAAAVVDLVSCWHDADVAVAVALAPIEAAVAGELLCFFLL